MHESGFSVETFYHAAYVAFAFGCLMFGALAFRQILDNLEVRRMQLGEDLVALLSPIATIVLIGMTSFVVAVSFVCYSIQHPTVYAYAFPMVLGVQTLQFALRAAFQRVNLKTRGIVLRSVLFGRVIGAPYETITLIVVEHEVGWTRVTIHDGAGMVAVFRIFRHSTARMLRVLERACQCPIHSS